MVSHEYWYTVYIYIYTCTTDLQVFVDVNGAHAKVKHAGSGVAETASPQVDVMNAC